MKTLRNPILIWLFAAISLGPAATPSFAQDAPTAIADAVVLTENPTELCQSLKRLEALASLGKLNPNQEACLERQLSQDDKQTGREKLSLILMANAYASGDRSQWAQRVKHHLAEIDQSNADLCYKYALYLYRAERNDKEVIRWAETSLENRFFWKGRLYKSRVTGLKKLKTIAAHRIWQNVVQQRQATPSPELAAAEDRARNRTKVLAREWLEYAQKAGSDFSAALNICLSAAGTTDYCEIL